MRLDPTNATVPPYEFHMWETHNFGDPAAYIVLMRGAVTWCGSSHASMAAALSDFAVGLASGYPN